MQYVLDCVTMLLNAVLCFFLLYGKYPMRTNQVSKRFLLITAALIAKGIIIYLQIPPINFISGCIIIVLMIRLLFNCNITSLFMYSAMFAMLTLSADALGVIVVSAFHQNTISVTLGVTTLVWQHHIWNWLIQIVLIRIAGLLIRKKERFKIQWHEIIFYILLIAFEVGIFSYFSYATKESTSGFIMLMILIGFLVLDLYIMYIFHKISQWRENERQMDLMHQQEKLQLQMYQELQDRYQTTCEIAHDMNRHITALKMWITEQSSEKAEKYLSELLDVTKRLQPRIKNQNAILEIILNTVALRCEKENIQFDMEVEDFPMGFISDMDITTIFSNLLDNAIDACMDLENESKEIKIVMCRKMGLIALRIVNSCSPVNAVLPQAWHSTKKEHTGIGLSNVKKTVEKYEGVMSVKVKYQLFQVSVTIPIDKIES